ncbi:MAG: NADPH dehydrogenase NamA [Bacteroidetes bacterium]|nr:NADPH dehydrogenase NamA [Bacteroidota bacterium]
MSMLFSTLKIKEIEFRNRIAVSPMCEYSSVQDGFANDWHLVHLGSRAVGGAGLIIQEATAVSPEGRITAKDLGIYKDAHIPKLKQIVDFIHNQGAIAGIQIAHAGRKASHNAPWEGGRQVAVKNGGWQTLSASATSFTEDEEPPVEMSKEDINDAINDFSAATIRALEAGYKVLEIHAAHGYLIHQFLSPLSNTRTDEYGGSFENRIRFLLEIVRAVKKNWDENLPLLVRISSTDWVEGGWDVDQSVKLSSILKSEGVDLIDCSSGGTSPHAKIPLGPGYQVPFAQRIKKETGIMTGAVGLITTAQQAEEILNKGQADLIMIAREFLRDPYFPLHAAYVLGADLKWPSQYERAKPR